MIIIGYEAATKVEKLKINFVDFWPNFLKTDNYFFHLLSTKYEVAIDETDPDVLFFSVDYNKRRARDLYSNHRSKKVLFTGENVRPNFDFPGSIEYPRYSIGRSDAAFTFDYSEDPRNFRLPLWVLFINWFNVPHREDRDQSYLIPLENLLNRCSEAYLDKPKFCNFIFSNNSGERIQILSELLKYKRVDCAGSLANNMSTRVKGRGDQRYKAEFISEYKFTIAAENTKNPGYTTEKIIHPLSVGSVPIYWGSERVSEDFNKDCFVNADDFSNFKDLADYIKMLDNNDAAYEAIVSQPVFVDNKIPTRFQPESVLTFFEEKILC